MITTLSQLDPNGSYTYADYLLWKFDLYQEAGVLEYWLVSPTEKMIQIFTLNEAGIFIGLAPIVEGDTIYSPIIEQLALSTNEIFME